MFLLVKEFEESLNIERINGCSIVYAIVGVRRQKIKGKLCLQR